MRKLAIPRYAYVVFDNTNYPYPAGVTRYGAQKLKRELTKSYGDIDGPFLIKRYILLPGKV
jgi:hypothetical protein